MFELKVGRQDAATEDFVRAYPHFPSALRLQRGCIHTPKGTPQ